MKIIDKRDKGNYLFKSLDCGDVFKFLNNKKYSDVYMKINSSSDCAFVCLNTGIKENFLDFSEEPVELLHCELIITDF